MSIDSETDSKSDALHLNPVTQNFQLRPNLTYLDNLQAVALATKSKAARDMARDGDGDSSSEDDSKAPKLESKAVQVTIKQGIDLSGGGAFGKGSGGGNGRAGADLMDPLRAKEGEAWISLDHFHAEVSILTNLSKVRLM